MIPIVRYATRILLLILLSRILPAQIFQNWDGSFMAGPYFTKTQTIGNSGVTLYGSTGYAWTWGAGRQVKRIGGASLWLDFPLTFFQPAHETATIPGSISLFSTMLTPGARIMMPLSSRISALANAGGGGGFFEYPAIQSTTPNLTTNVINHGVLDFGGGVDFRISQFLSLRVTVVDYVTGRNLSGVPGRNHPIPMFGFVMH